MTEKLDDVWASRDFPVLREVAQRIDAGAGVVEVHQVAEALGVEHETVGRSFAALCRRGLLLDPVEVMQHDYPLSVCDISGTAYLITGLHPDGEDALESLISALRQAAETSTDEDDRSNFKRAASGLAGLSGKVGSGVLTAWLTHQIGA